MPTQIDQIEKFLINTYGIATNLEDTGYIMPSGTPIDLHRSLEFDKIYLHEDAACLLRDAKLLPDGQVDSLLQRGVIRAFSTYALEIEKEPTPAQYDTIYKMLKVNPEMMIVHSSIDKEIKFPRHGDDAAQAGILAIMLFFDKPRNRRSTEAALASKNPIDIKRIDKILYELLWGVFKYNFGHLYATDFTRDLNIAQYDLINRYLVPKAEEVLRPFNIGVRFNMNDNGYYYLWFYQYEGNRLNVVRVSFNPKKLGDYPVVYGLPIQDGTHTTGDFTTAFRANDIFLDAATVSEVGHPNTLNSFIPEGPTTALGPSTLQALKRAGLKVGLEPSTVTEAELAQLDLHTKINILFDELAYYLFLQNVYFDSSNGQRQQACNQYTAVHATLFEKLKEAIPTLDSKDFSASGYTWNGIRLLYKDANTYRHLNHVAVVPLMTIKICSSNRLSGLESLSPAELRKIYKEYILIVLSAPKAITMDKVPDMYDTLIERVKKIEGTDVR